MLSDIWFPLVNCCCIAWITWLFMSNRSRTHPPLPPGPIGLPMVGMLPFLDPQLHTYFTRLAQTYGPLMSLRVGKKTWVVVGSPSLAKEVLKDIDITFANRDVPAASRELCYDGKDITFLPYGTEWRMLRKATASGMLGPARVDAVCDLRRQCLHETIKYLHEHAGCPVNIGEQMFLMVFNMITRTIWGKATMDLRKDREGADFRSVLSRALELQGAPNVSDFFPGLAKFDLQGVVKKMRDCKTKLDGMIESVIEERRKMDSKETTTKDHTDESKDLLQFLLQLLDKGDTKPQLTMDNLKGVFIDLIVGGTDTTSNTLEFAMAEIVNKPEVMKKAQQELETVVGAGNPVEESHIYQLPYLQAIMKETLRLHPTVPLLAPHSPSKSCMVGGYTIPKGAAVFINVWAIQRNPSLWEDPLVFKPERFLDKKHDYNGNDFSYFPFGSGRRKCPGIAMAERMFTFYLASLLHYFDWKLPRGVKELDFKENFGFTLKKETPLLLIPLPRSSNTEEQQAT